VQAVIFSLFKKSCEVGGVYFKSLGEVIKP